MVEDTRIFYSKHMGVDQFADRTAAVFKNEKTGHWEVDFWKADELVETVVMKTEYEDNTVYHNGKECGLFNPNNQQIYFK